MRIGIDLESLEVHVPVLIHFHVMAIFSAPIPHNKQYPAIRKLGAVETLVRQGTRPACSLGRQLSLIHVKAQPAALHTSRLDAVASVPANLIHNGLANG